MYLIPRRVDLQIQRPTSRGGIDLDGILLKESLSVCPRSSSTTSTMARRGKRWILEKCFEGFPQESDLRLEEFDLPELKEGEVLLEAEYLSVDPYMRAYCGEQYKEGDVIVGQQVAKVIESRNTDYPVGTWTIPYAGWVTHTVHNCEGLTTMPPIPEGLPRSYTLGTLGMPGLTACLGFLEVCDPKPGETVLISGAAGAVGHVVGQMAKIKGSRVIGSAGSDAKVAFLKELGFDEAFNYKTITDLDATIKKLAPKGLDIYFDNVGGEFATVAIQNMKPYGRISCCGAISGYNKIPEKVSPIYWNVVSNRLKMQGYVIFDHEARYPEWLQILIPWVQEGKIKVKEHVTEGFENMFKAFYELLVGGNTGKAIVKV